jgi:hypothetical protein
MFTNQIIKPISLFFLFSLTLVFINLIQTF